MQCSLPEVSSRRINVEVCCSLSRHELLNILDHLSSHICGDESLCALLRIIPVSHPTHQSDEGWALFSTNLRGFHRLSPPRLSIAVLLSLDAFSSFHLVQPFLAEKQRCVNIQNVHVKASLLKLQSMRPLDARTPQSQRVHTCPEQDDKLLSWLSR